MTTSLQNDDDERTDVAAEVDVSYVEEKRVEGEDDNNEDEDDELLLLTNKWSEINITLLQYEDVDYTLTDMPSPLINEDASLVLGKPFVRIEKAPQNSRRIFAGVDIPASVDEVWNLLTDYDNLEKFVPNLVANEVLELLSGCEGGVNVSNSTSDAEKCKIMSHQMNGSVMKQVGGTKVMGVQFSARMTLEVREWPMGTPNFEDKEKGSELERYVFPKPFTVPSLPHKDVTMQSIQKDSGDFRMYQGNLIKIMSNIPMAKAASRVAVSTFHFIKKNVNVHS